MARMLPTQDLTSSADQLYGEGLGDVKLLEKPPRNARVLVVGAGEGG